MVAGQLSSVTSNPGCSLGEVYVPALSCCSKSLHAGGAGLTFAVAVVVTVVVVGALVAGVVAAVVSCRVVVVADLHLEKTQQLQVHYCM